MCVRDRPGLKIANEISLLFSLSLSVSFSASIFFPQTGIQKLKNLLDNPNENGANGEEPRGFDAQEFMGHYTCVRSFFISFFYFQWLCDGQNLGGR